MAMIMNPTNDSFAINVIELNYFRLKTIMVTVKVKSVLTTFYTYYAILYATLKSSHISLWLSQIA